MTSVAADAQRSHELNTIRDVFALVWGPRRHIGIFSHPSDTVADAATRASHVRAGAAGTFTGQRILEVGCGFGLDAYMLATEYGCIVTATDCEEWRLAEARRSDASAANVRFEYADHRFLPYPDESFDAVWATETLSYSPDLGQSLQEIARVVRVGGRIAIEDFTFPRLLDPRAMMNLNDTKQLWSADAWKQAFASLQLRTIRWEDWSTFARDTYSRLAKDMSELPRQNDAVRASILNMHQRVKWIDCGAFRPFFAILEKPSIS